VLRLEKVPKARKGPGEVRKRIRRQGEAARSAGGQLR